MARETTKTLQVYEQLRADILAGRYEPGTPLRIAALTERFGTAMSVVREALVRLAGQHLTVLSPNSGFKVAEVSRSDLIDLTDLRVQLECTAIRRSVENGDVAWAADVVSTHFVLERTPISREGTPGTTDDWSLAHAAFHDALISACGSPRLIVLTRSLRDGAELYRQLSASATVAAHRDVAAEHRELRELATSFQADAAAEALERHIRFTTDLILDGLPIDT